MKKTNNKSYFTPFILIVLLLSGCTAIQSHMVKIDQAEIQKTNRIGVRVQRCSPTVYYIGTSASLYASFSGDRNRLTKKIKLYTRKELRNYFIPAFSRLINKPLIDISDWDDQLIFNKKGYIDYLNTAKKNELDLIVEVYGCSATTISAREYIYSSYESFVRVEVKMTRASDGLLVWTASERYPSSYLGGVKHNRFEEGIDESIHNAVDNILSKFLDGQQLN